MAARAARAASPLDAADGRGVARAGRAGHVATRRRRRPSSRSRSARSGAARGARRGSSSAATCPTTGPGRRLELVIDLGFRRTGAGFQAEGLVWFDGEPLQGVHPRRTAVPMPQLAPGPFTRARRSRVEPVDAHGVPPDADRLADDRRRSAAVPAGACRPGRARRRRVRPAARRRGAVRRDAGARRRRPAPSAAAAHAGRRRSTRSTWTTSRGTAAAARARLAPALALPARPSSMRVVGVGHAHIDSAWLWPIRETVRKCARTFASAVRLMDDRPEYRFVCSQAAQYDWMRAAVPGAVRAHPRQGGRRPVRARRRHVGRGRHEPAQRREPGPPAGARAALVRRAASACAAARCGSPTCSATRRRCRRSSPPAAATGSSPRSSAGTSRTASRTTRSGGRASTARGC